MTTAQQSRREALVASLGAALNLTWADIGRVADFIIAEQERREGPLVKAAEVLAKQGANHYGPYHVVVSEDALVALRAALAAFHAIDAPPQRTVEQIAADVDRHMRGQVPALEYSTGKDFYMLPKPLMDELAAALKRGKE